MVDPHTQGYVFTAEELAALAALEDAPSGRAAVGTHPEATPAEDEDPVFPEELPDWKIPSPDPETPPCRTPEAPPCPPPENRQAVSTAAELSVVGEQGAPGGLDQGIVEELRAVQAALGSVHRPSPAPGPGRAPELDRLFDKVFEKLPYVAVVRMDGKPVVAVGYLSIRKGGKLLRVNCQVDGTGFSDLKGIKDVLERQPDEHRHQYMKLLPYKEGMAYRSWANVRGEGDQPGHRYQRVIKDGQVVQVR